MVIMENRSTCPNESTALGILQCHLGDDTASTLSNGGITGWFNEYVPDSRESDANDALKIFKGIIVMRLMRSDYLPALVGGSRELLIGSLGCAYNKRSLDQYGITHIITVGLNIRAKFPEAFKYLFLQVRDSPSENLATHFSEAIAFIDHALGQNGRVLVHCFMGRSRSATIICAYLMKKRRMRYHEALTLLRRHRPQAQPNMGFMNQLLALEKSIFGSLLETGGPDDVVVGSSSAGQERGEDGTGPDDVVEGIAGEEKGETLSTSSTSSTSPVSSPPSFSSSSSSSFSIVEEFKTTAEV